MERNAESIMRDRKKEKEIEIRFARSIWVSGTGNLMGF